MPAISVLIPVRDAGPYLDAALSSISCQDFRDLEIVAVDDASTDGSGGLLADAAKRDPRIRIIPGSGTGIADALNRGLAVCRAPLIARMDADDIAHPTRLGLQAAAMAADPELLVLGGAIRLIDSEGQVIGRRIYAVDRGRIRSHLPSVAPVAHPATMLRASAVRSLGGYRGAFRRCEDYDLWLRCSRLGPRAIGNLPETILDHRIHGASVSQRNPLEQEEWCEVAWWMHRLRLADLPEPELPPDCDAIAACDRFPDGWRRLVKLCLLLRRAPRTGGSQRDPGQLRLLLALLRCDDGTFSRGELSAFHLRCAGFEARHGSLLGCLAEMGRSVAASPSVAIAGLLRRMAGRDASELPSWRMGEDFI